jgi:DUF4097 and DUF4098 domain-containing protein YvlB
MKRHFTSLLLTITMASPAAAAQSGRERELGRAAEQLGRTIERAVERTVENAMRSVEHALHDLDRYRDDRSQQEVQRIDTTFTFSRDGTVDLSSISGNIVVTGWNRGEARIRASSERGRLRWSFSGSRISIESESVRGRMGDTRYELSVPEGVRVTMRSTSGSLTARGIRGGVDAHTTSGDVEVTDAGGRLELASLSGEVRGSRLRGDVEASSVSGSVELDDVEGRSVALGSTSGDIVLTNARSRDVTASTVSGGVEYRGSIESGGQYEFRSHSGPVTISIPENSSARFSVETFSGSLGSEFPVTLQPDRTRRGRRLEFNLGGGDARVVAESFSGSIDIRRYTRR